MPTSSLKFPEIVADRSLESGVELVKQPLLYEKLPALKDLRPSANESDTSDIMGRNKSGRSTLSEILAGVAHADSRSVIVKGGASFPKLGVAFLPKDPACSAPAGHCGPGSEEV